MAEYEIKEVYGKASLDFEKLGAVMFRAKKEKLADEEEFVKILEEADANRHKDFVRLCAFHEGRIYAGIHVFPFDAYFDGQLCKMSGIGCVISDFNAPFKGAMKQIYKKGFEIMREKGQYISHLYPFEENYYRQYGYEVSCQGAKWYIPIEKLCVEKSGVSLYYDGSCKMQNDIKSVFRRFASDKNLMIAKSDKDWESFFCSRKPYSSGINSYVHYDDDGNPDAYMSYTAENQEDKPQNLVVDTLWFDGFSALRGILSYFLIQRSYCDRIILNLPETVDISPVVDSTGGWGKRNVYRTIMNLGTTRVVDVEQVLKMAKYKGEGRVCIKIYDDLYAPWNNDCFTVSFGDETIVTRGGQPDIEMKITSFSSGITGRLDAENIEIFTDVKIHNEENLHKVFYKKHVWTEEHF